jgi:hypothetical protein
MLMVKQGVIDREQRPPSDTDAANKTLTEAHKKESATDHNG